MGIPLPEEVRHEVEDWLQSSRRRLPPARWVPPENRHLTLVFLGETAAGERQRLGEALAKACAGRAPFRLQIAGSGSFPPHGAARVLWLGVREGADLVALQADVQAAAEGAVTQPLDRRPYHAHLTLGRCRRPWPRGARERWDGSLAGPLGPPFEVADACLFRSHLGGSGAVYEVLDRYPLGARA